VVFDMVGERIIDYRAACEYMMSTVGDRKRAIEFLDSAENFKKLQAAIVAGKKLDKLKVEPPLTPSLILGYGEEERQKSISPILNQCL
jgi:hypothetical protein